MRTVAILLALLAGCATYQNDPRDDAFNLYAVETREQLQAGKLTNREAVVALRNKRRELGVADAYTEELDAYRIVLAGKIDRGEMSQDEAHYLEQQKANELLERIQAGQAAVQPAPFNTRAFREAQERDAARQRSYREILQPGLDGASVTPGVTCRPSILGNVTCQ